MECSLPQFIFLKSNKNDKYLRYRKEKDATHACLEFSEDAKQENVEIQYVKFEVQKSETLEGFVHIRSCYNNKYWVRKCEGDEKKKWIAVEANEAEEDQSKVSCTLFKPVAAEQDGEQDKDKEQKIRLVHIDQEGQQGCMAPAESGLLTLVDKDEDEEEKEDVFIAYNAVSSFILPDYVALSYDDMYNASSIQMNNPFLDFNAREIGACMVMRPVQHPMANPPRVEFHFPSPVNARWGLVPSSQMIWIQPNNFHNTPLVDVNPSVFLHCVPVSPSGSGYLVSLRARTITANARFGVVEPVLRREISNVRYALQDARVYNVGSLNKYNDERWNKSSVEQTGSFKVSYTVSRSMTWGDSVSVTTGVTASVSVPIPFVGIGLGVELSEERNQTVEFGKEESSEETVEFTQNLTIPSGTKLTLLVVATRALCDVPFTCTVVDTLTNGTVRRYTKSDGLFTGANEFGFQTRIIGRDI